MICSKCFMEMHQRDDGTWYHCEDQSAKCINGEAIYARVTSRIKGKWCGADRYDEK